MASLSKAQNAVTKKFTLQNTDICRDGKTRPILVFPQTSQIHLHTFVSMERQSGQNSSKC